MNRRNLGPSYHPLSKVELKTFKPETINQNQNVWKYCRGSNGKMKDGEIL